MKYEPRHHHFYWFVCFFIKYSTVSSHGPAVNPYIAPGTAFGTTKFMVRRNKALAIMGAYCKSTYKSKEAEELLDFTTKHLPQKLNRWRRYNGWGKDIRSPMCAAFPNAERTYSKRSKLATTPISEHKFFQSRDIEIPVKPGTMRVETNEFLYVSREPVKRPFLECDCSILGDQVGNENICVEGSTIYLSKGMCADMSFFVHTPSWPATEHFNVVAHINFLRNTPNQKG